MIANILPKWMSSRWLSSQWFKQPLSMKQLIVVFSVALLFFIWVRIDFGYWVDEKAQAAIQQSGMAIQYETLHLSGISVVLKNVSLPISNSEKPLIIDQLALSPAWSLLLGGHAAVAIDLLWQGSPMEVSLFSQDDLIVLQDLKAELNVASLIKHVGMPLPVNVEGDVAIEGEGRFAVKNGFPQSGDVNIRWLDAKLGMGSTPFDLGEIALLLRGDAGLWHWNLSGDPKLGLQGKGDVQINAQFIRNSKVNGDISLKPDANSAAKIASFMKNMLGKDHLNLKLSGTFAAPNIKL